MGIEFNNQQIYALYEIENWWHKSNELVFNLSGAAGTGKAQPLDTIIPTTKGNIQLGDLQEGDYVFNRRGKQVQVLGIFDQGELEVFKVTFEDGRSTLCNDEHLWSYFKNDGILKTSSLKKMIKKGIINKKTGSYRYYIPLNKVVEYTVSLSPIDFYKIGKEITDRIPEEYLYTSSDQRWSLIKGIFDINGYVCNFSNEVIYNSMNKDLVYDIKLILDSLGVKSRVYKKSKIINDEKHEYYLLTVVSKNNFFERRKIDEYEKNIETYKSDRLAITSVEDLGYKTKMRCIYVDDPEHLYLTNDYIVTHNTTLIQYFIERIGLDLSDVAFVAYMGKAAMQMARNKLPAQTIHSLIYTYEKVLDLDENGNIQLTPRGKPKTKFVFVLRNKLFKKIKLIVLDEASMVNEDIGRDLMSFGIPIIALGDLNQLPPVFGKPFFLQNPDVILTQVMRQAENDPIVWLAHRVLNDLPLDYGVYGKSSVLEKSSLNDYMLKNADIVLTGTNSLRNEINNIFREQIYKVRKLDMLSEGEKIICRKNNWNLSINDSIFLTNGMAGTADYVDIESFNGKGFKIDFKPDFLNKKFKNITVDYKRLFETPGSDNTNGDLFSFTREQFEFAYAITVHLSQGSQYPNVLFLNERMQFDKDTYKKLQYTAITRARESVTILK